MCFMQCIAKPISCHPVFRPVLHVSALRVGFSIVLHYLPVGKPINEWSSRRPNSTKYSSIILVSDMVKGQLTIKHRWSWLNKNDNYKKIKIKSKSVSES